MVIKSNVELEKMKIACRKCKCILEELKEIIKPGITTYEIEKESERLMEKNGVISAFKNYKGYPANICISVNEEVVHGIPRKDKILKEGDIVSLDVGVIYEGFYGDCADTVGVGKIDKKYEILINTAREAFKIAFEKALPGMKTGDIGFIIEKYVEKNGFSVVKQFAGHGIGRNLHEPPEVPNFGIPGEGEVLKENMVIAIEPMINEGISDVEICEDGWTVITRDRKYSAHYENCILVKKNGNEILTEC